MKKIIAIAFLLFSFSQIHALDSLTYFWTINLNGDTATVTKWRANNDSILVWARTVADTINRAVVHFNPDSLTRDSTITFVKIDTVSQLGRVTGAPLFDTIYVDSIGLRTLTATGAINAVYAGIDTLTKNIYSNYSAWFDTLTANVQNTPAYSFDSIGVDKINGLTHINFPAGQSATSSNSFEVRQDTNSDSLMFWDGFNSRFGLSVVNYDVAGAGDYHVSIPTLKIGEGSKINDISIIDGAQDTLSITVGAKTWKFLPVANQ